MKKAAVIFLIACVSCDKYGDIIPIHGTRIIAIENCYDDERWVEHFSYDHANRLIEISNLTRFDHKYTFQYEGERIRQYLTYNSDGEQLNRDSIAYNAWGQIEKIYNFSFDSFEPRWIEEFEYHASGTLETKKSFSTTSSSYYSIEKYYWRNGNVIQTQAFNEDLELDYEFFYAYDEKNNFKNSLPYLMHFPVNWSKNNVTEVNWFDYVGNIESGCMRPCETKYDYNLDGYPVNILYEGGPELKLSYE